MCAEGRGVIADAQTVHVTRPDGSLLTLKAKNILIATGGVATKIPIEGAVSCCTARMHTCTHACRPHDVMGSGVHALNG